MKVFYLNDERKPIKVRIMDARFDPVTFTGDSYHDLGPAEGKLFEVVLPAGGAVWVKKWPNMVMISCVSLQALADLGPVANDLPPREQPPEDSW
jgi:hypothetical protein